jgi:hypothetical protein
VDLAKWQKIVCSMLKLPFAIEADGVLLPSFYQGLVQIHKVSIFSDDVAFAYGHGICQCFMRNSSLLSHAKY